MRLEISMAPYHDEVEVKIFIDGMDFQRFSLPGMVALHKELKCMKPSFVLRFFAKYFEMVEKETEERAKKEKKKK